MMTSIHELLQKNFQKLKNGMTVISSEIQKYIIRGL